MKDTNIEINICPHICLAFNLPLSPHLDADFIDVSWQGKAFLAVDWLTEDDKLLEEEHPSLFGTGEDAVLILNECEGVLLQEFPLCSQLTL